LGNAKADCHAARDFKGFIGHDAAHCLSKHFGAADGCAGRDNGEFLSAPTNDGIRITKPCTDASSHRYQHSVANGMAVAVIDALEVVDVEHDQRHGNAVAFSLGSLEFCQLIEGATVADPGEPIRSDQVFELDLGLFERERVLFHFGRHLIEGTTNPRQRASVQLSTRGCVTLHDSLRCRFNLGSLNDHPSPIQSRPDDDSDNHGKKQERSRVHDVVRSPDCLSYGLGRAPE
jgi:hypothetical protein